MVEFLTGRYDGRIVCNEGVSFGVIIPRSILFVLIGVFLLLVIREFIVGLREKNVLRASGSFLIMFGAFLNLFDRIQYGCVVDFIQIFPFFPWFNTADVMIFIGGVVYVFGVMKRKTKI